MIEFAIRGRLTSACSLSVALSLLSVGVALGQEVGRESKRPGSVRWTTINLASHSPPSPQAQRGMPTTPMPPGHLGFKRPEPRDVWVNGRPTAEPDIRRNVPNDPGIPYVPTHLCARIAAPAGSNVYLYKADGQPVGGGNVCLAAMRTRARYAFSIHQRPDEGGRQFFGTIDVIRGPRFPKDVDPKTAAIPIVFTEEDLVQLSRERMLTKFIVLEDPELALDYPTTLDQPIRYDATFDPDAVRRAKKLGKIFLVVYVGNRVPSLNERSGITQTGSLLLSKSIRVVNAKGQARELGPQFILAEEYPHGPIRKVSFGCAVCAPSSSEAGTSQANAGESCDASDGSCGPGPARGVDPLALLNNDSTQNFEYLCDGGDRRPRVGWVAGGNIINIDPEDTVAEYRTPNEGKKIIASNRVCLFAPRYVEVRVVQMADGYDAAVGYGAMIREDQINAYTGEQRGGENRVYRAVELVRHERRLKGMESSQWAGDFYEVRVLAGYRQAIGWASMTGFTTLAEATDHIAPETLKRVAFAETLTLERMPEVMAMVAGTGEVVAQWKTSELKRVDAREGSAVLVLEKSADRSTAQVGEEVTFVIRYTNKGTQPVTNITIVDSLTTRLEYVAESADSDRPAVFTTRGNEADSVQLRWEIRDPLPAGQSGMVKFTCKIR